MTRVYRCHKCGSGDVLHCCSAVLGDEVVLYSASTQVTQPVLRQGVLHPFPGDRFITVQKRRDIHDAAPSSLAVTVQDSSSFLDNLSSEHFVDASKDCLHSEMGVNFNLESLPPKLNRQVEMLAMQHLANLNAVHKELAVLSGTAAAAIATTSNDALVPANEGGKSAEGGEGDGDGATNKALHTLSRIRATQSLRLFREMESYQAQYLKEIMATQKTDEEGAPASTSTTADKPTYMEIYREEYKAALKSLRSSKEAK